MDTLYTWEGEGLGPVSDNNLAGWVPILGSGSPVGASHFSRVFGLFVNSPILMFSPEEAS